MARKVSPIEFAEIEKRLIRQGFGPAIKWLDEIYDAGSPPWDHDPHQVPKGWFPPEEDFGYDEIDLGDLEEYLEDRQPRSFWVRRMDGKFVRRR